MLLPPFLGNLQLFAIHKWLAIKTGLINKNGKKVINDDGHPEK